MYYGKKIILRGIELSDVDEIMKHWNNMDLRKTLGSQLPASREEELEWVRNSWAERKKGTHYSFMIEDFDKNILGTVGIFGIHNTWKSGEIGISILDKKNRGKGYGSDAVITAMAIGFNILNLHHIQLSYLDGNPGSKAYYNIGFKEIGRFREKVYNLGKYIDLVYMDMLKDEFIAKYPEYTLFPQ